MAINGETPCERWTSDKDWLRNEFLLWNVLRWWRQQQSMMMKTRFMSHANKFTRQIWIMGQRCFSINNTKGDDADIPCHASPNRISSYSRFLSLAICRLDTHFSNVFDCLFFLVEIQIKMISASTLDVSTVKIHNKKKLKTIKTGCEPFGNWFGAICTFTWNHFEFNVSKWNSRVCFLSSRPFSLPSFSSLLFLCLKAWSNQSVGEKFMLHDDQRLGNFKFSIFAMLNTSWLVVLMINERVS